VTKPRGRNQVERSLVDMGSQVPEPVLWRPDLSACHHDEYRLPLLGSSDALRVRVWTDSSGKVVHFAMVQITRWKDDEEWMQVVRVDCAHDQVHIHRYVDPEKEVSKERFRSITCQEDVVAGYEYAETVIFEKWEMNRRRWEHG
jgi:hypothetical protein